MAIRLGAEDKKKRLIAFILVSVALTLIAHMVWDLASGPSTSAPPPAPSLVRVQPPGRPSTTAQVAGRGNAAVKLESASELDPTLHPELMAFAENTRYTGTSRNIFSKNSLPPAAIAIEKPVASARTGPVAPAGPPPPPPINLKFYGFATDQDGRKLIFLLSGEDVFVAGTGDIVDRRYKVVQIGKNSVVIEDLSYNNQQTLPLQTS